MCDRQPAIPKTQLLYVYIEAPHETNERGHEKKATQQSPVQDMHRTAAQYSNCIKAKCALSPSLS